ncbi:MAG: 3'-5' exonuclease domain-containing protein 2 [Bacteroidales bacterium]|nr:3'-5' exonuclease domain-containing protein 2 [Bacteroidales bacterium]
MYKCNISPEELENLPLKAFEGEIVVIDKPGFAYLRAVEYLKNQPVLGFDTETKPSFNSNMRNSGVALLQLSDGKKAFLFRINKMGLRSRLCKILSDPAIVKVGAATHDDVRGLQKKHKFEELGFVDLQQIAVDWGIMDKSVKKLAGNILGIRISKAQQLSNWEASELSAAQQLYAATDAWVCREMYLKLIRSPK